MPTYQMRYSTTHRTLAPTLRPENQKRNNEQSESISPSAIHKTLKEFVVWRMIKSVYQFPESV